MAAKCHFLAITLALLISQTGAQPSSFLIRLLREPLVIDLRIRIASVTDQLGLGFGGILQRIGVVTNKVLTGAGDLIQKFTLKFANALVTEQEHNDHKQMESELERWIKMYKEGTADLNDSFQTAADTQDHKHDLFGLLQQWAGKLLSLLKNKKNENKKK